MKCSNWAVVKSFASLIIGVLLGVTLESGLIRAESPGDGDWFQWRGPDRTGVSKETGLASTWAESGPPMIYEVRGMGGGMASVSIFKDRLYSIGEADGKVRLVCRKLDDGELLWATPFASPAGSPNGTPTVDPDTGLVYALSFDGVLACCNGESGKLVWSTNFQKDFGGKMESVWGYSESPLIDGNKLICTPGAAKAMVVALNKNNGKVIWAGPAPAGQLRGNDGAGYSSVVVSEARGVRQYIQLIGHGVVSYAANDGRLLWNYDRVANGTANIPTPIVHENFVFCSSGYDDGGTALLEIQKQGKQMGVREVYYKKNNELQNHHGGMIMIGDYVYLGHGHNQGFPACIKWKTGENVWGKARGAGSGSAAIVAADGKLYFRYQDGTMALIAANPAKYELLSQFKLPTHEGESWPHPVIQDGRLYVRDQDYLQCFDISAR
jgi:outer membrane protein assembly factor BamB